MSQINWYRETSIISFMFIFEQIFGAGNTNNSIAWLCVTVLCGQLLKV